MKNQCFLLLNNNRKRATQLAKKLLAKIEFNALHPIRLMGLGVSSGDEKSKEEKEPKIHYEEPMLPFT